MIHSEQNSDMMRLILSFIAALLLTVMPLPHFLIWFRPQWMLVVLLFWVITKPSQYGILLAWFSGMMADLVAGTPFGQQAIIFVLITYFVLKLHLIIVHSPRWQQAVIIGTFSGCAMVLQSLIAGLIGHAAPVMRNELSVVATVVVWPLIYGFLDDSRRTMRYL
ncbi:MAG: rod shape-determining protein MreD [Coxiellaceae bacterium]|nr:rod shape-determining protein MreD [Coxiellaceae bacterium]